MSPPLRASVLLLALSFLGAAPPTPPKADKDDPSDLGGLTLLAEKPSPFISHLAVAEEQIRKKDWAVATTLLQKVLDQEEDEFIPVKRKDQGGKEVKVITSLRSEANRLLGSLPPKGRAFYEGEYGPRAAKLLRQAATDEVPAYADLMQRFPYTRAGLEATERLATRLLDRGQYAVASLCFEKLLDRAGRDSVSPQVLFRAALAFRASWDEKNVADLWKRLRRKVGEDGLKLGPRTLKLDGLRKELDRVRRPDSPRRLDWPMFRGDSSRSAQAVGGTVVLRPRWRRSTFRENATRDYLKQAVQTLAKQKRVALPGMYPIGVMLARRDGKVPLVVYRDFWGIHAVPLRNVGNNPKSDEFCKTGDIYWEAPMWWSIDQMLHEPKHTSALVPWIQTYLGNGLRPEVLFENSVVGSLSADGRYVFAIEDFQVAPYRSFGWRGRPARNPGGKLGEALHRNTLEAYDLDSGKLTWVAGWEDVKNKHGLRDTFFLGPPLILDGKLYVLGDKNQEIRLIRLDAAAGRLLSRPQHLATFRVKAEDDPARRCHAAHLACSNGILVCPTNGGAVFGLHLDSGDVLWTFSYPTNSARFALKNTSGYLDAPPGYTYLKNNLVPTMIKRPSRPASAPIIHRGRVVFTAPDSDAVHCLRLRNGQPLWTHPLRDDDLYVGGVLGDKVLIVGGKGCQALRLEDGKVAWTLETGVPSGMGVAADGRYYLPLRRGSRSKQPEICILDVARGRIIGHTRFTGKESPGNLLLFEGHVISQTLTHITAYPQLEGELKRLEGLLLENTRDAEARVTRGNLRLYLGDLEGSILDFRAVLRDRPAEAVAREARDGLFAACAESCRRNFDAAQRHLADFKETCGKDTERLSAYYLLLARGRDRQGKAAEAIRAYLDLLDLNSGKYVIEVPEATGQKGESTALLGKRVRTLLKKLPAAERARIGLEVERRLKKAIPKAPAPPPDRLSRMLEALFVRGPARLVTLPAPSLENLLTPERFFADLLDRTELGYGSFPAALSYAEGHSDAAGKGLPLLERMSRGDTTRRRRYLLLVGRIREQQGKYVEAAKAYADFYALHADLQMMSVPGEMGLRVRPASWLQGRMEALLRQAPKVQHPQIRGEVLRRVLRGTPR